MSKSYPGPRDERTDMDEQAHRILHHLLKRVERLEDRMDRHESSQRPSIPADFDVREWVASLTPRQRDYVRLCLDEERAEAGDA